MQLITTRNKEISFAELKKAISSGNGLELIRPGDKFAIELKNGEHVNAVCGGYVNEKRARFVLEDCLTDKWRMNDTPTNKGGYLKSEGRRHVLEDILPLFPDELAEAFEPRFMSEEIDGERHEYPRFRGGLRRTLPPRGGLTMQDRKRETADALQNVGGDSSRKRRAITHTFIIIALSGTVCKDKKSSAKRVFTGSYGILTNRP